ncbi:MAG: hypothetical protein QOJ25_2434 [Solirubrobacteraceae bacterium]|nr:hypothetical protein [Solirubrobacteraceae bacterium]
MAKATAIEIEVPTPDGGSRAVRVSSPDREIYPPTDRTPSVTKKMVAEYVAAVGVPLLGVLRGRPTALERWPGGVHPGMRLAVGGNDKDADGFYQKRVMKGAPDYVETAKVTFPSGRTADELCPSEIAVPVWCAQMGTITFHPWAVRVSSSPDCLDQPDELRIDLDPQPGTTFSDVLRVADVTRETLLDLGMAGFCKTSGNRGVHVFVRIEPRWDFTDVRHAAIALGRELEKRDGGVTTAWWKEERGKRIFVDYNQNCRDRSIASAWSLRAVQGATVSTPLTWPELAEVKDSHELNLFTVPERLADKGDPWRDIDDTAYSIQPLLDLWDAHPVELNYPPDYPKMPGEPPRVQPSKKVAAHWDEDGNPVEG